MPYIRTDFVVSSGMLAPLAVYEEVGLPEEGLFIDNIDLEWCFRARAHGYTFFGVCAAELQHQLGDATAFLPGLKQLGPIHLHSPLRQYYIARNRVALYFRSYCPLAWKFHDIFRLAFKFFYFSLLVPPRSQNLALMLAGIRDGMLRRSGPYRPSDWRS
jgi:rhamnosyltransferase